MSKTTSQIPARFHESKLSSNSGGDFIAEVYKALKASFFYPENHPLRNEIISKAYQLLLVTMNGNELSLLVARNGLSSASDGIQVEKTLAAASLAKELFVREIQRLSFLPDLPRKEFDGFLSLLTADPQKIVAEGGMEKILADRGVRSVITNEIDISSVFTKKGEAESDTGEQSHDAKEIRENPSPSDFLPVDEMEDMEIDEIIAAMKGEKGDERYVTLAGMLLSKTGTLKAQGLYNDLVPIALFLIGQHSHTAKSSLQRKCAQSTLESMADEEMINYLLNRLEERGFDSRETVYTILRQLGEKAVGPSIRRLNSAGDIHSRKAFATALMRIGRPAVPSLVASLQDHRWYVVRGMLTILGETGCNEWVRQLRPTIYHEDERVRKEAIRCLTKAGGPESVALLIELLSDQNPSVVRQAVFSLGILKADTATDPLMGIVNKRDIFLKSLQLKKEALQAIGLIGSRRILPYLMKTAGKRYLFAARRREELKVSIVETIGRIGDESSLGFLQAMSSRGGTLGSACSEAIHSITGKMSESP
jgi:hypothetical protein